MEELERFIEYDPAGFTLREAIIEAKRCLHCSKPRCRTGCPIENEIPDFIEAMAHGNLGSASTIIAKHSNLPAVCGRVCPHEKQCEGSCILNKQGKGIKVGKIERFIADMDGDLALIPAVIKEKRSGRIAVIGSGPAGLTVAGDLAKMGFSVTVYDAQQEAGGVLMYGIPEFRLPKQVVRREVKKIANLGVQFNLNTMIGPSLTLDNLFEQGFDAVFIGTGNALAKSLSLPGIKLPGAVQATYFLQMVELANQGSVDAMEVPIHPGDNVVIIGAGNTAIDAARTAIRREAASVTVLNRDRESHIAALASEVASARKEGVNFTSLRRPLELIGEYFVTGVLCHIMSDPGEGKDLIPTEKTSIIPANKVIIAIGQRPASRIIGSTKGIEVDESGYVKTRDIPYGMSMRSGVFSGGDVVNGPATVVKAMKDAKTVAKGIAQYVEAKKLMEKCGLKMTD
ncbi:NAD(P)-dependent oxidoreductase [Pectinatus haikarae]|uniref:Glutamate synthase (NADPH/NADH) small chain n=1 Tax=Pectinatus haikarae TaxID=349096 RepID=A0ABT9Y6T6_9FIRM|nr:NAD(P)-dependent oxidoreductase [Pectinatus haikarae]MDQ0203266.1 glutamate synthase (NADPH/NADH) small chain [Pectinatus haikarae]